MESLIYRYPELPESRRFLRVRARLANVTYVGRRIVAANGLLIGCITSVNGYV